MLMTAEQMRDEVVITLLVWWLNIVEMIHQFCFTPCIYLALGGITLHRRRVAPRSYTLDFERKRAHLRDMVQSTDITCYNQIRMYRATFDKLCLMLDNVGGLKPTKHMLVDEQVVMFLHILAHHVKNRVIQFEFGRSGETISRHFNRVLIAMMHLQRELWKQPEPVTDGCIDERWKWFKVNK